jgi:signal transduction histidine kinase
MSLVHFALGVALAALLIEVWFGIRARRSRRMAEADLARLGGGLLNAQEAERARIARELHDGISQELAVLALELDALEGRLADSGGSHRADAAILAQRARTIAADVQQVTRGLHPARLEHLGLLPAVRALAHEMEHSALHIEVSESAWPERLPSVVALSLYRVAQEALHNAVKHGGAGALSVTFRGGHNALTLTVSDAGIGFDAHGPGAHGGLGIVSMRQRLRAIGGSLTITTAPGGGTQVQARLPHRAPLFQLEEPRGRGEDAIFIPRSPQTL